MRGFLVLALLAACESSDPAAPKPAPKDDPEERCDPKETRVCVGTRVVACEDGKLGRALRQCSDTCRKGRCVGSCAEGAELIYVVDSHDRLHSFDPRKLPSDPFKLIGVMNCGAVGSPFSMSVDRGGTAWVLYTSGDLFEVSTMDAKCKPSGFKRVGIAPRTFGMGFVTDVAGAKSEKLYVAANDGSYDLMTIDTMQDEPTTTFAVKLPRTSQHPELTGTSEGKLFGFFPSSSDASFVQEIDRKSGSFVGTKWELGDRLGLVEAYAFAHWGGVFYLFVTSGGSTVRAIDRRTGGYQLVLDDLPYRITGAGVSTCAPERDQPKAAPGPT
jgi:hypothetical protein